MEQETKHKKINFKKNPYRGTFVAVANKLSKEKHKKVHVQAVHDRYSRNDPKVTEMVLEEIAHRKKIMQRRKKVIDRN